VTACAGAGHNVVKAKKFIIVSAFEIICPSGTMCK
jgi:hypothetical protein